VSEPEPELPEGFRKLPPADQQQIRAAGAAIGHFAFRRTRAVMIGPGPGMRGSLRNGSLFVLTIGGRYYLVTARHVLEEWRSRSRSGEAVVFQVGSATLDPGSSLAWESASADIAMLTLTKDELAEMDIEPCEATLGWPPPTPRLDEYVFVCGFPGYRRELLSVERLDFTSLGFLARVTGVDHGSFTIQFERDHWITTGSHMPPPGVELGGMSGGPAFLLGTLAYPVVGVVSEHSAGFELMRISMLAAFPGRSD